MLNIYVKEINSEYSLEGLVLKLQYFGHLMRRADPLEKTLMLGKIEGERRRGGQRMRLLVMPYHRCDGHEFEQDLGVGDGQGGLVCCHPWGCKELDTTEHTQNKKHFYFGYPSLFHHYTFHEAHRLLDHKDMYPNWTERIDSDILDFESGAVIG